jgi:outer membrane protein OmpA-like peptidoglycan-associated protein
MEITMKPLHGRISGVLAASFISFLFFGSSASAQLVSRGQIVEALTVRPKALSIADSPRLTRSMTLNNSDYVVASADAKPAIDLQELFFKYNSTEITVDALPQLHELGAALSDPTLKGATISINGHTDGVGGDAFNKKLSKHRAEAIKRYLVEGFKLPAANLHAVGYGKQHLKNKADVFAPENRRVEIVNETPRTQAQR